MRDRLWLEDVKENVSKRLKKDNLGQIRTLKFEDMSSDQKTERVED